MTSLRRRGVLVVNEGRADRTHSPRGRASRCRAHPRLADIGSRRTSRREGIDGFVLIIRVQVEVQSILPRLASGTETKKSDAH